MLMQWSQDFRSHALRAGRRQKVVAQEERGYERSGLKLEPCARGSGERNGHADAIRKNNRRAIPHRISVISVIACNRQSQVPLNLCRVVLRARSGVAPLRVGHGRHDRDRCVADAKACPTLPPLHVCARMRTRVLCVVEWALV